MGITLTILGGLGGDFCKKGRSIKMNTTMAFGLHFRDLGGLGECTWRLLEATLGDLGHKLASLGRSWRQVGNFLATCWDQDGQRWPKMANFSEKSQRTALGPQRYAGCRCHLSARGGPPGAFPESWKLDFDRIRHQVHTRPTTASRGRRISNALRAQSRHRAELEAGRS